MYPSHVTIPEFQNVWDRFILTSDMKRSSKISPEKVFLTLMTSAMTPQWDFEYCAYIHVRKPFGADAYICSMKKLAKSMLAIPLPAMLKCHQMAPFDTSKCPNRGWTWVGDAPKNGQFFTPGFCVNYKSQDIVYILKQVHYGVQTFTTLNSMEYFRNKFHKV